VPKESQLESGFDDRYQHSLLRIQRWRRHPRPQVLAASHRPFRGDLLRNAPIP
jgi:hypothetical protein